MSTPDVAVRVERLRATNAAAVELGMLCSLAVRVEPDLVRRLRLLVPDADVAAETDLWHSDLLSGAAVTGIAIAPDVAATMRRALREPGRAALRDAARDTVTAAHAGSHWSLRLEERLYALDAVDGDPARAERLLFAAVGELAAAAPPGGGLDPAQTGIARWLLGALARLPDRLTSGESGAAARIGAGLTLDGRIADEPVPAGEHWLPWLLERTGTTRVAVAARFDRGRVTLNADGPADPPRLGQAERLPVPGTDPLVVDLDWHDGLRTHSRRVRVPADEPVVVAVDTDTVHLTALDGTAAVLRRLGAGAAPGGLDFAAERAAARPCLARSRTLATLDRYRGKGLWIVVAGSPGIGKTVVACAVADDVEDHGGLVLAHFYGARADSDDAATVETSLADRLESARGAAPGAAGHADRIAGLRLQGLLERVDGRRGEVLVLFDDVPDDSTGIPLPRLPDGVTGLITARTAGRVRSLLVDHATEIVYLDGDGDVEVCTAVLERATEGLWAAFGAGPDGDGIPRAEQLIGLAGANPGRLASIVDWALDRPVGSARLERIPWLLTDRVDELWTSVRDAEAVSGMAAIAVAHPGIVPEDVHRVGGGTALEIAMETGSVTIGEDRTLVVHPRLAEAFEDRFSREELLGAHARHVDAVDRDPLTATPYGIAHAVRHGLAAGAVSQVQALVGDPVFVYRRATEGGVAGLAEDAALLAATGTPESAELRGALEAVGAVAAGRKDRIVELLAVELRRRGVPATLGPLAVDPWVPDVTESPVRLTRFMVPAFPQAGARWIGAVTGALTPQRMPLVGPDGLLMLDETGRWHLDGQVVAESTAARPVRAAVGGSVLAVGDQGGVEIADLNGRAPSRVGTASAVTAIAVVGERSVVAGTESGAVIVADAGGFGATELLVGHGGAVTTLAEVPENPFAEAPAADRERVVTGSADGTARVWDLGYGRQLAVAEHRAAVTHAVPTEDGTQVVSADATGAVRWWSVDTGDPVRAIGGHRGPLTSVVIAGDVLATAGEDGRIRRITLVDGHATDVAAGPVARNLLVLATGEIVAWRDDDTVLRCPPAGPAVSLRPSEVVPPVFALVEVLDDPLAPEAARVVVAHSAGATELGLTDGGPGPDPARFLGVSTGGAVCAVTAAGTVRVDPAGGVTVMDAAAQCGVGFLEPPDGRVLIGHRHGLELTTVPQPRGTVPGDREVHLLATNGRVAAVSYLDGAMEIMADDGGTMRRRPLPVRVPEPTALAVAGTWTGALASLAPEVVAARSATDLVGSGQVLIGERDGTVRYVRGDAVRSLTTGSAPVTALAVDELLVVAGTADGLVLVWPVGGLLSEPQPEPVPLCVHDGPVTGLAVVGAQVVSSSTDGTVRVCDISAPAERTVIPFAGPVHALAATGGPEPTLVARTGPDSLARIRIGFRPDDPPEPMIEYVGVPTDAPDASEWSDIALRGPVEVRGLRVPEIPAVGIAARLVSPGNDVWARTLDVAPDGRLRVPLRIGDVRITLRVDHPPGPPVDLLLTTVTPGDRSERTATVRIREMEML